jgi:aryl-alcohol dehydrogenase-like predicted oxidoreductase
MPRKETYGKTEEIIGNWFQEKKNRDKIILASKIASKSDGLEWIRDGSENLGFDKKNMNAAIDASLKRLKTDYIDLYQLHWPERKVLNLVSWIINMIQKTINGQLLKKFSSI